MGGYLCLVKAEFGSWRLYGNGFSKQSFHMIKHWEKHIVDGNILILLPLINTHACMHAHICTHGHVHAYSRSTLDINLGLFDPNFTKFQSNQMSFNFSFVLFLGPL